MTDRYRFIANHASQFPVTIQCRVLEVGRSGFYAWRGRCPSAHTTRDQELGAQIRTVFVASRQTYGSPRIHAELHIDGVTVGRKRVARLMRQSGLVARQRRPSAIRTTDSNHQQPLASNVLDRQFTADAPNQRWMTDITYLATREGWLYLAVVLDLFARMVVGWAMRTSLDRELVLAALTDAIGRRQPAPGLLHHSDRGSQYASGDYQALLIAHGMIGSMSRKGNCWDNAPMESFFATLKAELEHQVFDTHAEARRAVFMYIEQFYNRQRRHSTLAYATPLATEQAWEAQSTTVG